MRRRFKPWLGGLDFRLPFEKNRKRKFGKDIKKNNKNPNSISNSQNEKRNKKQENIDLINN